MSFNNNCCPDEGDGIAQQSILTDQFCGFFELSCNNQASDDRFVWQSTQGNIPFPVAGTVTISYDGGCAAILRVNVRLGGKNGAIVGTLAIPDQPGSNPNSKSITLQQFDTLEIICTGTGAVTCKGEYCFTIHYPSPF